MREITEAKPATSDLALKAGASNGSEMVVARVPQGYDTKINIRFVPGRDIRFTPDVLGCQPRQGATRRDAKPVALPESLIGKLKDANKRVVDWLARDSANSQLFLARPVEALMKAGIELTRSEQKALERSRRAVTDASVVPPGVKVVSLSTSAHPKGRVGGLRPGPRTKEGRDHDSACEPTGKE